MKKEEALEKDPSSPKEDKSFFDISFLENWTKEAKFWGYGALGLLLVFLFSFQFAITQISAPMNFPIGELVTVEKGMTGIAVAELLEEQDIIRSNKAFALLLRTTESQVVVAGDYLFDRPQSLFTVVRRLSNGLYGDSQIKLTIPEGSHNRDIAAIVSETLPSFDTEKFLKLAEEHEGYLFPDTYLVFPSITPELLLEKMQENFAEKIATIQEEIDESGYSLEEVIIMASIIEKEAFAGDMKEHQTVAGILWKRIDIDMPLQVDAPFKYLLDKASSELTREELRTDSPYNTYTNKGLPIGPINNPGMLSIQATLNPLQSPYLFYLHDSGGRIHYAVDHNGHVANKRRYLD